MAKIIWREALEDDPIFNGQFVISTPKSGLGSTRSAPASPRSKAGRRTRKSTPPAMEGDKDQT